MSKKPTTKEQKVPVKTSKVSVAIFLATLVVVLISLTPVIFPALVVRTISPIEEDLINPWETGVWSGPLIAADLILLGICILYTQKKLPEKITNSIKFIFGFEVSKKVACIVIVILLGIYIGFSVGELATEEMWPDYNGVKQRVQNWNINQIGDNFEPDVRYFLLSGSVNLFGNIRVIPFIASIALLVLTYFITQEISKKRFAGLVAIVILLQSNVFLSYDTTATYENFWILFYLLSLYLIYKKWPLSPVSYILSIFSKALTSLFLPMTLFFIYRSETPRKTKIRTAISYGVMTAIGLALVAALGLNLVGTPVEFSNFGFWQGFTSMAYQLRFDVVVLIFLLPLTFGLFFASKKGILQADSIMVLIASILLTASFLTGFTMLTNQPYRFVPLVVFFAIGVGTILSKRVKEQA